MSIRRHLFLRVFALILVVLGMLGVGMWYSMHRYLSHYLVHLRHLAHQHHHETVGQAHMGLNLLHQLVEALTWNVALAGLVALTIGAVGAYYLAEVLSRPLKSLTRGAYAISRGATNFVITPSSIRELADLANVFNDVARALADGERQRQERLEQLAHEIRTPLTALMGYSRAMAAGDVSLSAQPLEAEIGRIQQLTAHLPDAAPLSAHLYHRSLITAEELVQPIRALYQPVLHSRHIAFETEWDTGMTFDVDAAAIHEALHNLLSNALKHTPSPGTIRVGVHWAEIPQYGVIVVEDSGSGISDKQRDDILEPRGQPTGRQVSHGLGLIIVHSIVQAHGGLMAIQTSALGGAAIVLMLPTKPVAEDIPAPSDR
ncbi:MAG: HAMP domain-containing sensor histidine kinase [Thermaerobacter sp.]|nr:HAMP domain-containing sensor histidine kinase [Thermaerobacter sp.]